MEDININIQDHQSQGINKVFEFCDIFDLQNLIKSSTCETKTSSTLIDVILTNRVRSFRHSKTVETGINDFHKLVMTSFRSTYQRARPTKIRYRSYKTFDENAFLTGLRTCPFHECLKLSDSERAYENFKLLFLDITNKHAPVKTKVIRGNNAPFMNKELSKEIMVRSELRNKFNRHKSKTNWKNYAKQRNKCT